MYMMSNDYMWPGPKMTESIYNHRLSNTLTQINRVINDAHYDTSPNGMQTPIIARILFNRMKYMSHSEMMLYQRSLGLSLHFCIHGDYPRKVLDKYGQ